MDELDHLLAELRTFVRERDWEQFHDPKNLAMALVSEAGELAAELRWVASADADAWCREPENHARLADEAADVAMCLLLLCDRAGIDLPQAVLAKLARNRERYPADAVRGTTGDAHRRRGGGDAE